MSILLIDHLLNPSAPWSVSPAAELMKEWFYWRILHLASLYLRPVCLNNYLEDQNTVLKDQNLLWTNYWVTASSILGQQWCWRPGIISNNLHIMQKKRVCQVHRELPEDSVNCTSSNDVMTVSLRCQHVFFLSHETAHQEAQSRKYEHRSGNLRRSVPVWMRTCLRRW